MEQFLSYVYIDRVRSYITCHYYSVSRLISRLTLQYLRPPRGRHRRCHGPHQSGFGLRGLVALVLLAEAHPALSPALWHAYVVHHEEVDVDVICAAPAHFEVG